MRDKKVFRWPEGAMHRLITRENFHWMIAIAWWSQQILPSFDSSEHLRLPAAI